MVKLSKNVQTVKSGTGIAIYVSAEMAARLNLVSGEIIEISVDEKKREFKGKILKKGA